MLINQFIHNAEEHPFSDTYLIELIDPTGYSVRSRLFHPLGDKNTAYTNPVVNQLGGGVLSIQNH